MGVVPFKYTGQGGSRAEEGADITDIQGIYKHIYSLRQIDLFIFNNNHFLYFKTCSCNLLSI